MLRITQAQIEALAADRRRRFVARLDGWLAAEVPGWAQAAPAARHEALAGQVAAGQAAGLTSEMDLALFARLLAGLGPQASAFLDSPPVRAVLAETVPNPGGKLRALYRLAGAETDAAPGAGSAA